MKIRCFPIFLVILFGMLAACKEEQIPEPPKMEKRRIEKKNTGNYTGQILGKSYFTKGGKASGQTDLYIRLSMGDYFIKFCESGISKKDIEAKVDSYINFKGDLKSGEWDSCPGDKERGQSRTGPYITINNLLE